MEERDEEGLRRKEKQPQRDVYVCERGAVLIAASDLFPCFLSSSSSSLFCFLIIPLPAAHTGSLVAAAVFSCTAFCPLLAGV